MIGGEEISIIPVIECTLWGRNFDFCEDQAGIETVNFVEHGDVLKRLEIVGSERAWEHRRSQSHSFNIPTSEIMYNYNTLGKIQKDV